VCFRKAWSKDLPADAFRRIRRAVCILRVTETKTVSLSDPWSERPFKRHFEKDSLLV